MIRIIFQGCLLFCSVSSAAQLHNYDHQGKVRILSSYPLLQIEKTPTDLQTRNAPAFLTGAIIPPLLDLGASVISESKKHSAEKYSSSFTVAASADGFWINDKEISLPVLVIKRMVLLRGKTEPEEALRINLIPELSSDKSAFRFRLDSFKYRYSSAKTKAGYDYINLDLFIDLKTLAVSEGQYKLVQLRSTSIAIPMVKAGSVYQQRDDPAVSGWLPFPPMPSFKVEAEDTDEVTRTVATRGTSNGKPDNDTLTTVTTTVNKKGSAVQVINKNSGNYEIVVEVYESNPYKNAAAVRSKITGAGAQPLAEVLKALNLKAGTD